MNYAELKVKIQQANVKLEAACERYSNDPSETNWRQAMLAKKEVNRLERKIKARIKALKSLIN